MYLSQFGVKNYKCLGEIDIPLTPIHVLIGQNDCGKTSLLEAIAALFKCRCEYLGDMFPQPWIGSELVRHGTPHPEIGYPGISLRGQWNNLSSNASFSRVGYEAFIRLAGKKTPSVDKEYITIDGRTDSFTLVQSRDESSLPRPPEVIQEGREMIWQLLGAVHKYAFDAKLMAQPAALDPARNFRLDSDGFGLATLLDDILGYDPRAFLRMQEEFCSFFPQFHRVCIETERAVHREDVLNGFRRTEYPAVGKGVYFETKTGEKVRARHASDGAVLFLGFLALAYLPAPPNLLLIEEPENGIYPKRLGQVIELLKQLVHRTEGVRFPQIIMTTHSPYVLSFFEPEEVTFLSRPSEPADAPVRARPLRDAPNIRERMGNEFYLGELWYNLSEEDLFGDA